MSDRFRIRAKSIHYCHIFEPLNFQQDGSKRWGFTAEIDPAEAEALGLPIRNNEWVYPNREIKVIQLTSRRPFPVFGIDADLIAKAKSLLIPLDAVSRGAAVEIFGFREKTEFRKDGIVLRPVAVNFLEQPAIPTFEEFCTMIEKSDEK